MIKTGFRGGTPFILSAQAVPNPVAVRTTVSGLARYCLNIHRTVARSSAIANILAYHLVNYAEMLGFAPDALPERNFISRAEVPSRAEWAAMGALLEPIAGLTQAEPWTDMLADLYGLTTEESLLLRTVCDIGVQPELHTLAMALVNNAGLSCGRLLDLMCGLQAGTAYDVLRSAGTAPETAIARHENRLDRGALPARSTLVESGLMIYHIDINTAVPRPHPVLAEVVRLGVDPAQARDILIGAKAREPVAPVDMPLVDAAWAAHDFPRIDAGDWVSAVANGTAPANIAIGGVPGSGRRAAAMLVASRLGLPVRELTQPLPSDNREILLQLYRIQGRVQEETCLLRAGADAMLANLSVNETIDLFDNAMPVIWLIDRPSALPDHVARMFDATILLPDLNVKERRRWRLHAGDVVDEDDFTADSTNTLTAPFDESRGEAGWKPPMPAMPEQMTPPGAVPGGPLKSILDDFLPKQRRPNQIGKTPRALRPPEIIPEIYDTALVNADQDLMALADRLSRPNAPRRFSLLLWGMAGTGKSAYVRWLAGRLGLPVKHRRCSDLVDRWVGATEQNIATAFAEAREEGAFLVFDEADSLLADRRDARAGWEIGQVNEMLTQMEAHPLPFACTTNLADRLDQASMRRFLLKVRFDPLTDSQVLAAWRLFFGRDPSIDIDRLGPLTPADFDLVKREAELLHDDPDDLILRDLLIRETARRDTTAPIGFGRR